MLTRLRVWEVSPYRIDDVSGITTLVKELSRCLVALGCSTIVLCPESIGGTHIGQVEVKNLAPRGPFRNADAAWQTAIILWKYRRQWDLLHLHQAHPITLVAALVARFLGKPAVVTFHVLPPAPSGFRAILHTIVHFLVPHLATQRVYVSEHTKLDFRFSGTVIRNGIDIRRLQTALGSRNDLRSRLRLSGFVVVFAGRKAKIKGFADLLAAVRLVRDTGIDVRLLTTGSAAPGEEQEVPQLVEQLGLGPFVVDLGERPDHLSFLSAGDAFALPSYREGSPLALLEAMAAGLPVVASTAGGIPEIVVEGQHGVLVRPGDVRSLANAIRRFAEDPGFASRMGANAKEAVRLFDAESVAALYRDLFEDARKSESAGQRTGSGVNGSRT